MARGDQIYKRIILIEKYDIKNTPGYFAVGERRLRVQWTLESIEDLRAYHTIDVEAELTALLSQELGEQIDRELIQNVFNFKNNV